MHVSFTGTRAGATDPQKTTLRRLWREMEVTRLSHGDCIGGDEDAHSIVLEEGIAIRKFPSTHKSRAWTEGGEIVGEPRDPIARNPDIVDDGDVLFACPCGYVEMRRGSGTWAAIRYARKRGPRLIIIWPDGSTTEE